jgi:four helix bundle protein
MTKAAPAHRTAGRGVAVVVSTSTSGRLGSGRRSFGFARGSLGTRSRSRSSVRWSGTSVGANYCEADDAVSGKEFRLKVGTCKKEARETKHRLRMIAAAEPESASAARVLWKEANELMLIFSAIFHKVSSPRTRSDDRPKPK